MKILIAAAPRTGSHAFSSIQPVKNNLAEVMNIEDMLLPRLKDDTIDFSVCSDEFLDAIEKNNWKLAWNTKPDITIGVHHFLGYTNQLEKIRTYNYPTLQELLSEHHLRWTNIQNVLDDWCIKLIKYQAVPEYILNEMIEKSDKLYVLKRKNKIDQALSMTKSTQSQLWHGTVNNPITNDIGKIDYKIFASCCKSIRENDKWLDDTFSNARSETVYYEDLDLSASIYKKNNVSFVYDLDKCQSYWDASKDTLSVWFKDFISNYDWSELYKLNPDNKYFYGITNSDNGLHYWNTHLTALNSIDIDNMNRDVQWLDIGVWFGIMPFVLKEFGFNNIETTDCKVHRHGREDYFNNLWKAFGITPKELEIRPQQKFKLDKKYDIITIMKSNVFWKTEEVIHYDGDEINTSWQNLGNDGKTHTYFTLYNKEDWEFFINNIREYLTPAGVAVINPEPWAYDKISNYHDTRDYLKQFQVGNIPIDNPYINYLVIRK